MRRCSGAFAASLIAATLIAFGAAAQTVKTSPTSGHPIQPLTITGSGFANSEAVDLYVDLTDTVLLVSSATGTLSASVKIPATAAPGVHYITAIGRKSGDAAQASFTVTTPWLEQGFGAAHLVQNPYENTLNTTNVGQLGPLWASSIISGGGTPAVTGGLAYFGASAGVAAVYVSSGATSWRSQTTAVFFSSPVVSGGYVYIGSTSGTMYALTTGTGTLHWSTALGGAIYASPVLANGILYVGAYDGKVYALNASTGAVIWTYATGAAIDGSAAVVNGVVYIGSEDHHLYALNAATGAMLWSYTTGDFVESTPAVANGVVYFGSDDNSIYALKAAGPNPGSLLWKYTTGGDVYASPAVADNVVYAGSVDKNIYALNAHSGALIWSTATGGTVRGAAVANGVVYATSSDDSSYVLNAATGAILGTAVTGANFLGNPVICDGVAYLASYSGPLYAFALQAGTNAVRRPIPATLHPNMALVAR